jgi:ABC-type transport system involved in multi-copper enzyme maturation permease subunit
MTYQTDQFNQSSLQNASNRGFIQIFATIGFELRKNLKKFLILLILVGVFFGLSLYLTTLQESRSEMERYPTPDRYIQSFLGLLGMLIMIIATTFGGSSLVIDFQEDTGNLLFPLIPRGRLMLGRMIANLILASSLVFSYYFGIGIVTLILYEELVVGFWISLGWAVLYTLMLLSFVTFVSSFMKRTSAVVVMCLILFLIIFDIIIGILSFTEVEPWFIPTYYAMIISQSLAMPDPRYFDMSLGDIGGEVDFDFSLRQWLTPSPAIAAIGMVVFTLIFLILGYIIYRNRQK